MFTGLIEEIGTVKTLSRGAVARLVVACEKVASGAAVGDSVCVSGVCLTVIGVGAAELAFDAVPETLSRSTLGDLKPGDRVNLEVSLRAGQPMGGHFVLGHVDGVGVVSSVTNVGDSRVLRFGAPREMMRWVVEKGSVAADGISLTVASCDADSFTVAVIPHTLSVTTLQWKRPGDRVNLEADIIGKYVDKFTSARADSGVTMQLLRDSGFV